MCLAPILIKNPNYGSQIRSPTYHTMYNTTDTHIAVPCGRCATCIHLRQMYLVQRVQMEALNHDLFFGTLTYNQECLPRSKFGDIEFAHVDISDWQKMIKMIRKDYPQYKFKYLLVTEYGGRKHRPHIHFILSLPKFGNSLAEKCGCAYDLFNIFLKYWRRNSGSTRSPIWSPLCTYVHRGNSYNYDLHYLDPNSSKDGIDGVSFYVTKYVLKYDDWIDKFKSKLYFTLSEQDYKDAWSLFRPRCLISKGFGSPDDPDVQDHIYKGIEFALRQPDAFFPFYLSRQDGSTFPLAPYYSKRFMTIEAQLVFVSRRPDELISADDIDDFDKDQAHLSDVRSFLRSSNLAFEESDIDDVNLNINLDYGLFTQNSKLGEEFATDWEDF